MYDNISLYKSVFRLYTLIIFILYNLDNFILKSILSCTENNFVILKILKMSHNSKSNDLRLILSISLKNKLHIKIIMT